MPSCSPSMRWPWQHKLHVLAKAGSTVRCIWHFRDQPCLLALQLNRLQLPDVLCLQVPPWLVQPLCSSAAAKGLRVCQMQLRLWSTTWLTGQAHMR